MKQLTIALALLASVVIPGQEYTPSQRSTGRLGITIVADVTYAWSFAPDGRMLVSIRNLPPGAWRVRAMQGDEERGIYLVSVCAGTSNLDLEIWPSGSVPFTASTRPVVSRE